MDPSDDPADPTARLAPVGLDERLEVLDVLRGVAVLGILPVNLQLMRGPDVYLAFAGAAPDLVSRAERAASFVIGWLFAGKYIASFAILFGIGAALTATRAGRRGGGVRRLLARRYGWLLGFGLLHMVLLFPGDILFVYGLTGLLLLTVLELSARARAAVAAVLTAVYTLLVLTDRLLLAGGAEVAQRDSLLAGAADTVAAATVGSAGDVLAANLWQVGIVQPSQLVAIPWILALFLVGVAATDAGWVTDPRGHLGALRRVAVVGLGIGLPANIVIGLEGPLGIAGTSTSTPGAVLAGLATTLGAPLLAAGILSAIAVACVRFGPPARLAAVGRLALSAYIGQSLLAAVVFVGFSRYGSLDVASSLWVCLVIWLLLLVACPAWAARFGRGPLERVWRRLTYGPGVG